jgi:hypothetical protein
MIGAAEAPVGPHHAFFYPSVLLLAVILGSLFTYGILAPDTRSHELRLACAGFAVVFLICALQAFERLLKPEKAYQRFHARPDSTRRKLRVAGKIAKGATFLAIAVSAVMHFTGNPNARDLGQDVQILSVLFLFVSFSLTDLAR